MRIVIWEHAPLATTVIRFGNVESMTISKAVLTGSPLKASISSTRSRTSKCYTCLLTCERLQTLSAIFKVTAISLATKSLANHHSSGLSISLFWKLLTGFHLCSSSLISLQQIFRTTTIGIFTANNSLWIADEKTQFSVPLFLYLSSISYQKYALFIFRIVKSKYANSEKFERIQTSFWSWAFKNKKS